MFSTVLLNVIIFKWHEIKLFKLLLLKIQRILHKIYEYSKFRKCILFYY